MTTPAASSRAPFGWALSVIVLTTVLFALMLRWSWIDNSPPAWDQGLYMFQATKLHLALQEGGFREFLVAVFNLDRGRVPLLLVLVQPAFSIFGPVLDAAVITLDLCWFLLAWALYGISRELAGVQAAGKACFFALVLFAFYPLTGMVAHSFLVELPLVSLVCASVYAVLMLARRRTPGWSIAAGSFIGLGLLTKVTFVVFVFPALLLTAVVVLRRTSFKDALRTLGPGLLAALVIALPYYAYNFQQILSLTVFLSSKGLADLYGFGDVFDVSTVWNYWMSMFYSPVFVVVLVAAVLSVVRSSASGARPLRTLSGYHLAVLGLWFVIPFVMATFGQIKDPRYLFPALVPLFIAAGLVIARPDSGRLTGVFIALVVIAPLPGFLYSNGYLSKSALARISALPGLGIVAVADLPPDPQDWQTGRLVSNMARSMAESTENRKVLFLGGNRYYHLRLLDYQGLTQGVAFEYATLPYYAKPGMTLQDALHFIRSSQSAGILYKTGENWPEFSSRLDTQIVGALRQDPNYVEQDLDVRQPDGSRFILFKSKAFFSLPIDTPTRLVGDWKVGGGIARIDAAEDGALRVRTETGVEGIAVVREGRVHVDRWGVTGVLTADLSAIRWNNGSTWQRASDR